MTERKRCVKCFRTFLEGWEGNSLCEICIEREENNSIKINDEFREKVKKEGWDWHVYVEYLFKMDSFRKKQHTPDDYIFRYNCPHNNNDDSPLSHSSPCSQCNFKKKKVDTNRILLGLNQWTFCECKPSGIISFDPCFSVSNNISSFRGITLRESLYLSHDCDKFYLKTLPKNLDKLDESRIIGAPSISVAIKEVKAQIKQIIKKYKVNIKNFEEMLKQLDKINTSKVDVFKESQKLEREIKAKAKELNGEVDNSKEYLPYILGGVGIFAVVGLIIVLIMNNNKKSRRC